MSGYKLSILIRFDSGVGPIVDYIKICLFCLFVCLLSFSLIGERISQQAIAQLIGDPRYLRFNVLIREDAKV